MKVGGRFKVYRGARVGIADLGEAPVGEMAFEERLRIGH